MALSNLVVPTPYISKTLWGDPITSRVNLLSKPPVAIVSRTGAAQSIANNADTPITFTTVVQDTIGGVASASNTPFTLPFTGTYLLVGNAGFASNATGVRLWWWYSSSVADVLMDIHSQPAASGIDTGGGHSSIYNGFAGEQVQFRMFQNSGGALNTVTTGRRIPMVALYLLTY